MPLSTTFLNRELAYNGVELRPHFLLTELGLRGSGIGAFVGPCRVATEHLVDWEDRLQHDRIEARSMIHFIGEFFGNGLMEAVALQRLIMATIGEVTNAELARLGSKTRLRRDGDDLFAGERKLSVSIVTASPVSRLLHVGINLDPEGAPVKAIGLLELGVVAPATATRALHESARGWAEGVLTAIRNEYESMEWACTKVRPVV